MKFSNICNWFPTGKIYFLQGLAKQVFCLEINFKDVVDKLELIFSSGPCS